MFGERLSIDEREQRLTAAERAFARMRELQMQDLAEFDVAQVAPADLPELPDGTQGSAGWRRATALVESLVSYDPPPANVSVIVDAQRAADTNGEAGVMLEAGPRVGRQAPQAILCDAETEVIARGEDGRYMDYGEGNERHLPL